LTDRQRARYIFLHNHVGSWEQGTHQTAYFALMNINTSALVWNTEVVEHN